MVGNQSYTQQLLQQLQHQIAQLKHNLSHLTHATIKTISPRFDSTLFHPVIKNISDYLAEIEQNYTLLTKQVSQQNSEAVQFLTEKLVNQIAALQRELATQSLRQQELSQSSKPNNNSPDQTLSQYQDYRRRLKEMRVDKKQQLALTTDRSLQQQLQKEIIRLEERYNRCCQAIKQLEIEIEQYENK